LEEQKKKWERANTATPLKVVTIPVVRAPDWEIA